MIAGDQSEVLAFLGNPASYRGVKHVERIDTHASSVFLAASSAYKLKRAVRYDYLDYSTPERRRAACEAEVRLNRRTAGRLYRGVVPITRTAEGHLRFGGRSAALDWVVVMRRFPQEAVLDRIAARHQLTIATARRLADVVARFHAAAEKRPTFGGAAGVAAVIDGNESALTRSMLDPQLVADVTRKSRELLALWTPLLDSRRFEGFVRQCHGDLHLRNIVRLNRTPKLFDAIEFNDELACIDVLYDLAFLLMDLIARGLTRHASVVFNHYLAATGDWNGVGLMPLFLGARAAIRAKTSIAAAELTDTESRQAELQARATMYLQLAASLVNIDPPRLVAIGGFSGSGKSTLAQRLAPQLGTAPGAVVLRSDVIRRQLLGGGPGGPLPAAAYTRENSQRVYAQLRAHARVTLSAGIAVIADAVFAEPLERRAIESVAADLGVPFTGIWLDATPTVLRRRLRRRRDDVSDATMQVLARQLQHGCGRMTWKRIAADGNEPATERRAGKVLFDR